MSEIKTPLYEVKNMSGKKEVTITENHTWSDIARWILKEDGAEDVIYFLQKGLEDDKSLQE